MKGKITDIQVAKAEVVDAAAYESATAAHLSSQYRRAEGARGAFVREAVAFGAMMIKAERELLSAAAENGNRVAAATRLNSQKRGQFGSYDGVLQDWMAKNCPEINYATARNYKSMAAKMVAMMGGETAEVMAALRSPHELAISYEPSGAETDGEAGDAETVSAETIEARERLFTSATSRRKLEQLWLSFAGRGPVGRPKGSVGPADGAAHVTDRELCERLWGAVANALAPMDRLCALVREMDYRRLQYFIDTMQDLLSSLKERKRKIESR